MTLQKGTQWGLDSEPDNWLLLAACRGHDPEWWTLAPNSDPRGREHNDQAVRICLSCPVRLRCLVFGQNTRSEGVIYGGQRQLNGVVSTGLCDRCGLAYLPVTSIQRYCGQRCAVAVRRAQFRARYGAGAR